MKRLLIGVSLVAMAAGTAMAQQIPNPAGSTYGTGSAGAAAGGAQPTGPTSAQSSAGSPARQSLTVGTGTPEATEFARLAIGGGIAEIQASELAISRTTSPTLKQFAGQMIADHGTMDAALQQLAVQDGVAVPSSAGPEHYQARQMLENTPEPQFDQAYLQQQITDHQQAIALYEAEAQQGTDMSFRTFAEQSLPTLRHHLAMAQQLGGMPMTTSMAAPMPAAPPTPPQPTYVPTASNGHHGPSAADNSANSLNGQVLQHIGQ